MLERVNTPLGKLAAVAMPTAVLTRSRTPYSRRLSVRLRSSSAVASRGGCSAKCFTLLCAFQFRHARCRRNLRCEGGGRTLCCGSHLRSGSKHRVHSSSLTTSPIGGGLQLAARTGTSCRRKRICCGSSVVSSRQSAYRIRLSRRASATIAIFLPRRFATARAHARNGAAFGSTDRNTGHAAWTSSD